MYRTPVMPMGLPVPGAAEHPGAMLEPGEVAGTSRSGRRGRCRVGAGVRDACTGERAGGDLRAARLTDSAAVGLQDDRHAQARGGPTNGQGAREFGTGWVYRPHMRDVSAPTNELRPRGRRFRALTVVPYRPEQQHR